MPQYRIEVAQEAVGDDNTFDVDEETTNDYTIEAPNEDTAVVMAFLQDGGFHRIHGETTSFRSVVSLARAWATVVERSSEPVAIDKLSALQRLGAIRDKLERIVCTQGEDAGVVLLDPSGKTHHVEGVGQVFDLEFFSPLGEALIELFRLAGGVVDNSREANVEYATVKYQLKCDPMANGRKPEPGESRWNITLPLVDGRELAVTMGRQGRDTLFGMLIADCHDSNEPEPEPKS